MVSLVRPFTPDDFSSTVAEQPDKVDQGQGQEQGQWSTQLANLKRRTVSNVQDKAPYPYQYIVSLDLLFHMVWSKKLALLNKTYPTKKFFSS